MNASFRGCCVLRRFASACRPHIHVLPCVVCDNALAQRLIQSNKGNAVDGAESRQSEDKHVSWGGCGVTSSVNPSPLATSSAHGDVPMPTAQRQTSPGGTVFDWRKAALDQWLEMKWDNVCDVPSQMEDAYLQKSWEAFCNPSHPLTDNEVEAVVELLDRQCDFQSYAAHNDTCVAEDGENMFLSHLRGSCAQDVHEGRQLAFQRTLLDFRDLANAVKLPFFLCCGTALAAHREGHFITHDSDIDVGVFYEDLVNLGDAQKTVVDLLSHTALDGRFVLFDVCGTVEKGLELRFLHNETKVPLDLNVYYPPLPLDDKLVREFGPFVWAATHYESSSQRRHGMYRYKHAPFRELLQRLPFCERVALTSPGLTQSGGFLVPPQSYLRECYGADWRTPRKFTYAEGLRNGGFANLIDE